MSKNPFQSQAIRAALLATLCVVPGREAQAGWSGLINGAGQGWASVNVTTSRGTNKVLTTASMPSPSAAMAPADTYAYTSKLPVGSSSNTVSRIKGLPGVVWQANTVGANGDRTDNPELEAKIHITAAPCASLTLDSAFVPDSFDGHTGTISVKATGTAGTALWLRGYEYTGDPNLIPVDDPTTPQNESIEFLKANGGVQKFETLVAGPFEFGSNGKCDLTVPFTIETGDLNHLYVASDGAAISKPMVIQCPNDMVVTCGQPVTFPDTLPIDGGCGDITATYSPGPAGLVLGENIVTVTAVDGQGDTATCEFKVTVVDGTAPTITEAGPNAVIACPAAPVFTPPTAVDSCDPSPSVVVVTDVVTPGACAASYSRTVTWQAVDASGNKSPVKSQTITVVDTTAPTLNGVPADTAVECSVGLPPAAHPTALDACDPSPVVSLVETSTRVGNPALPGYYNYLVTRTWTARDACNNGVSQSQKITVRDTQPPLVPSLPTVTADCGGSVTLTRPTTTDACAGVITGTTTDPLTYSVSGTYTVHWTFADVVGNSVTANQTVVVKPLTFSGFYSPIDGTGGGCGAAGQPAPLRTFNQGCNLPIKFDMKCGNSCIGGNSTKAPVVKIQAWSSNCSMSSEPINVNAVYQNDWHYNWNTAGYPRGTYKIIVILPDGSSQFVFVKLK